MCPVAAKPAVTHVVTPVPDVRVSLAAEAFASVASMVLDNPTGRRGSAAPLRRSPGR